MRKTWRDWTDEQWLEHAVFVGNTQGIADIYSDEMARMFVEQARPYFLAALERSRQSKAKKELVYNEATAMFEEQAA